MKPAHTKYSSLTSLKLSEGISLRILLSGSETNGIQAVFEDTVEPGIGPARHIHHDQDETFSFLEGEFDVEIAGTIFHMQPGDVAFVPKGTPHAWKNVGNTQGRLRYTFTPALNIEAMFREFDEALKQGELTEEVVGKIMANHQDQEIVGPPL